jgi:hypothetical protein
MAPIEAGLNPIVVMNSFSMGTHRARFWRKVAAYSGTRRRLSRRVFGLVEVAGVVPSSSPSAHESQSSSPRRPGL